MRRLVDPEWSRYINWRLGRDGRIAIGLFLLAAAVAGGYFGSQALAAPDPTGAQTYVRITITVPKTVRIREKGRVIVKRVPVVTRIYAKPVTVGEMRAFGP